MNPITQRLPRDPRVVEQNGEDFTVDSVYCCVFLCHMATLATKSSVFAVGSPSNFILMSNEALWTWGLLICEVVGIAGFWLVGARKWWGWAIVLAHSFPWLAYAIVFNKPGFIAMSTLWIVTHTRNMVRWQRAHKRDFALAA
jgi:hypothetical protein